MTSARPMTTSATPRSTTATNASGVLSLGPRLLDHDVIIWLGDLNYRLNLPEDAIVCLLRDKKLDLLKEFDQLTICKKAGEIFEGFTEPRLDFFPTYKYDPWGTEFARKDSADAAAAAAAAGPWISSSLSLGSRGREKERERGRELWQCSAIGTSTPIFAHVDALSLSPSF